MPKAKVEESKAIDPGNYTGKILRNEVTEGEFQYHETYIAVNTEGNPVMRASAPYRITSGSTLGRLLERFGAAINVGEELDTDDFLVADKKVSFTVIRKANKSGLEFSNIVVDTVMAI